MITHEDIDEAIRRVVDCHYLWRTTESQSAAEAYEDALDWAITVMHAKWRALRQDSLVRRAREYARENAAH